MDAKTLIDIYSQRSLLNDRLEDAVRDVFPIGKAVEWQHRQFWQVGRVCSHGYGDRLEVYNVNTGKKRWLRASELINEKGKGA